MGGPGTVIGDWYQESWASLVAQWYRIHWPVQDTRVRSLDWEDPLENGMATHSSILAWRIPWTEEPGGLQSMGSQKWNMTEKPKAHTSHSVGLGCGAG